jgi:regulator of protease activity HflC (stomatin/prohibitin superfamily)
MPAILRSLLVAGVVLIVALVTARLGFYSVEQGQRGVLMRFGEVVAVAEPGPHFKVPFIDTVRFVSVRTQIVDWSGQTVMNTYSRDQQPADLSVRLTYFVKPDPASVQYLYERYGSVESYEQAVIRPRAAEQIKTTFGQFNAVTAVQAREDLNARAEAAVVAAVGDGPGQIESVEIHNIDFSDAYEASIEARMQAEVEVQRVNQNLERERTTAQIRVVQAQAEADAVRLAGEAEAAAIRARGEAEAAIIAARGQALRENQENLVSLIAVEKWNGVLPTTMPPGSTVPFIEVPSGGARP